MLIEAWARPAWTPIAAAMALAAFAGATVMSSSVDAQVRGNAQSEQSRSLRERVFGRNIPSTARYVSEGGEAFVLDRSGSQPLLRFERRAETWVLRPSAAPRGDIIYRTESGAQVLRVTPDGGMTLYTTQSPGGSPVSMVGTAQNLTPPALGPVQLFNLMARHAALVSRALGRLVVINVDTGPESEALTVEALNIVTDAVVRMAGSETSRTRLDRLRRISISEGERASAIYADGELRIVVAPDEGAAGRPSSARVIRALAPRE